MYPLFLSDGIEIAEYQTSENSMCVTSVVCVCIRSMQRLSCLTFSWAAWETRFSDVNIIVSKCCNGICVFKEPQLYCVLRPVWNALCTWNTCSVGEIPSVGVVHTCSKDVTHSYNRSAFAVNRCVQGFLFRRVWKTCICNTCSMNTCLQGVFFRPV